MIRRGLGQALEMTLEQTMAMEADNQRAARGTADSMEGGIAFLQKRKPNFTGN